MELTKFERKILSIAREENKFKQLLNNPWVVFILFLATAYFLFYVFNRKELLLIVALTQIASMTREIHTVRNLLKKMGSS